MFGKLESFRGVAACIVLIYHTTYSFYDDPISFFEWAHLFVDFFFILSGFVMCYAYGSRIMEKMPFRDYIAVRLGRIYPLHLFILLLFIPIIAIKQYLYLSGFGGTDQLIDNPPTNLITSIFLINTIGLQDSLGWNAPSWSISSEFLVYIFFFPFTQFIDKNKGLIFPIVITSICYFILLKFGMTSFNNTTDLGFVRCLGSFYLGVFLFRIRQSEKKCLKSKTILSFLELFTTGLMIFSLLIGPNIEFGVLLCIFSFILTIYVFSFHSDGILGKILNTKIFRNIGAWSYSIYLVHTIVIMLFDNVLKYVLKIESNETHGVISILLNIAVLSITILISRYTYKYIETYFRDKIKTKVLNKKVK